MQECKEKLLVYTDNCNDNCNGRYIINLIQIIALNYCIKVEFKILHLRKENMGNSNSSRFLYLHRYYTVIESDRVNQEIFASTRFMYTLYH